MKLRVNLHGPLSKLKALRRIARLGSANGS
jgi:hypothetical protein